MEGSGIEMSIDCVIVIQDDTKEHEYSWETAYYQSTDMM